MAFTQIQLDALEKAIAEGVTRVKYETKEVEYRSLDEMLRLRDVIRQALGLVSRGGRILTNHSKGFDEC